MNGLDSYRMHRTGELDEDCARCSGNGVLDDDEECPECEGVGTVSPYHEYEPIDDRRDE